MLKVKSQVLVQALKPSSPLLPVSRGLFSYADMVIEDEFAVYEDVPVWKEHTNKRDFEKPVTFSKRDLERIVARCNKRISETGDYCPIVIGHTKDGQSSTGPKVVGFAGPFKIGRIGKDDPKWAILARKRFFKTDLDEVKRHPRCSVEYWASQKDPRGGYFDPISLLGAETPELDLGLRYNKRREGKPCRYQAVNPTAPCGANTFIPSTSTGKKKQTYSKEGSQLMLSQEDIGQIVEAIKPVVQACVEEYNALGKAEPMQDDAGDMDSLPGDVPPADMGDKPPLAAAGPLPLGDKPQDDDMSVAPGDAVVPEKKEGDEEKAKYQKEADEYRVKYGKAVAELRDVKTLYAKAQEQLAVLGAADERAYRYAKVSELEREGYVIPSGVEAELEHCQKMNFNRDQFNAHLDRAKISYQKVHLGGLMLPVDKPLTSLPDADEGDMAKRAKYSKEAMKRVMEARDQDKELSFFDAYNAVKTELEAQAA